MLLVHVVKYVTHTYMYSYMYHIIQKNAVSSLYVTSDIFSSTTQDYYAKIKKVPLILAPYRSP